MPEKAYLWPQLGNLLPGITQRGDVWLGHLYDGALARFAAGKSDPLREPDT
jgi:hypothetical protein